MNTDIRLIADRLYLRPFCRDDATSFAEAARESATSMRAWMPWCHADYTPGEAQVWFDDCANNWQTETAYEFGIFAEVDHMLLGDVGINQFNRGHNFANAGYWVRQSRQRHGIATRAVRCVARFGFEQLKLTRLEIVVAEGNEPSRRLAEKIGAQFECVAQNRLVLRNQPCAAAVYALLPHTLKHDVTGVTHA